MKHWNQGVKLAGSCTVRLPICHDEAKRANHAQSEHALHTSGGPSRVAVACDDGTLRLFTAEHGTPRLVYYKSMPRLGGRLLSVAWHPNGQSVVTGTAAGTLHAWHIAKSQELLRISIGAPSQT